MTNSVLQHRNSNAFREGAIAVGPHVHNADISTAITVPAPAGATAIMIQSDGNNGTDYVRFTIDGVTVPTTDVGFRTTGTDGPIIVYLSPGATVRMVGGAAAQGVNYQWFKAFMEQK